MINEAIQFRLRAATERELAEATNLPNVRDRALRSAARWDELAVRAEKGGRARSYASRRNGRRIGELRG